jgi:copper chaperone CopZ
MKTQLEIQNLKCGGCANTITNGLNGLEGVSQVTVDQENAIVSFEINEESQLDFVKVKLHDMGYPVVGDDNKILTKAKSYVSCAIGRVS